MNILLSGLFFCVHFLKPQLEGFWIKVEIKVFGWFGVNVKFCQFCLGIHIKSIDHTYVGVKERHKTSPTLGSRTEWVRNYTLDPFVLDC
jgi:hypothetical protein